MKAVSAVSALPKNRPMPSVPATGTSTPNRKSSRTGACEAGAASAARTVAVGCSAKAVTNTTASTAAPTTGAVGPAVVASSPTTTGPNTNAISSAADS